MPRALTPEEDEAFLVAAWEHRHWLHGCLWGLYVVYRCFGLRRTEGRYLVRQRVLEDRIIIQELELHPEEIAPRDRFHRDTWTPKAQEARVVVVQPWHQWAMEELRRWEPRGHRLLFADRAGRALDRNVVSRAFNRLLQRIAPDLTLHSLRHTYITELLEHGVPHARVRLLAGHRVPMTTERYSHVAVEGRSRDLGAARLALDSHDGGRL